MSTSLQDIIGQLQRSGILSDVSPGMDSGLFGKVSAPYGGAANLGLNLLANSGPSTVPHSFGQIVGQSALQAQQVAQQTQTNALQRQLMAMQIAQGAVGLGTSLQRSDAVGALLNGGGDTPGAPGQNSSQNGPNVVAPPPAGMSSNPTASPGLTSPGSALPSLSPQQLQAATRLALLNPNSNPLDVLEKEQQAQIQARQRAVQPQIAAYEDVAKSDSPVRDVNADPQLQATWTQFATSHGIDPVKGLNNSTVRTVFGFAANSLRAANGLPTQAPVIPMRTTMLPDGRIAQIDPLTGKQTVEAPSGLEKVVGPDGKPVLVPTGKATGMRPYNQMSSASDEDLQAAAEDVANYRVAPPTGRNLLSGNWPQVMKLVKQLNPNYDATQYNAKNKARQAFATGKQGDITRSLSVATDHLDQLSQAADALDNGGFPAANRVANFFSQQTGNPKVTNFNAMKEIVGDEVVKAVVGTGGASKDREAIKSDFSAANSPAQLHGVIDKYKGLMGGQLNGLRRQYEQNTGLKDFDQFVSPNAKAELGGNSLAPSLTNAKGWTLHTDKNGVQAYVSPDGKQYELAK